ncbi:hypothetical protein BvCmsKSP013_02434 [Escherichia coli]|nr:hypothetical protein BvCmsKSP013_02434 [Escherichia coli]
MIWQPEFTDKTLSRKPGAVHRDMISIQDDTFTGLSVQVVDSCIQAIATGPVFAGALNNGFSGHFIGETIPRATSSVISGFAARPDDLDFPVAHLFGQIVAFGCFYDTITANACAPVYEWVVFVRGGAVNTVGLVNVLLVNKFALPPLNGSCDLCQMQKPHITDIQAYSLFSWDQIRQLAGRVQGYADGGNIDDSVLCAGQICPCCVSQKVIFLELLNCKLTFLRPCQRRFS